MVKGALLKKSIKDMKKSVSQFISIFIMATVAVSIMVGLDSIWKTIEVNSTQMYSATNLSDIWISVLNPTEKEMWAIKNIDGVEMAEKRFTLNTTAKLDGSPTLKVYTRSEKSELDTPYLVDGNITSKSGAIIDESFAKAHNLKVGDDINIKLNDTWLHFNIEALALSSEHIFSVKDSTTMVPDSNRYGFIVVDEDKIKSAYGGMKVYNQVSIRLKDGADISVIQSEIDSILGDDLIGVITNKDNTSLNNVHGNIKQFKTLSTVFPVMFFLVTALITLSTMSRLVEDQRNQVGILKALGYSKKSIIWHYTSYGIYIGILAAIAGIIIGPNVIGRILMSQMKSFLTFNNYEILLNMKNVVLGSILIIICTAGVSCYASLKLQGDMPAVLLRNKPPKKGNHVFLEKIPIIWDKMKFSSKLIARNILKNKGRMLMSIFGVMGCTGLIIGAFALKTMVGGVSKTTYEKIYTYDEKIVLDGKTTDKYIHNLALDGVVQDIQEEPMQMISQSGVRRMFTVTVFSPESPLINLTDIDGNKVVLPEDGVAITRKLAEILDVSKGDTIQIKRVDDSYVTVKIKEIVYMVTGQGMYMSKDYWDSIGEDFTPTSVLVKWNNEEDKNFLQSDNVENYILRTDQKSDFESNLKIIDIAVVMLITAGGILAFVVLYNLSILNFFERTRDLATLQVLGFYEKEIRSLVLVENILSAGIGIFAGIPIGELISSILAKGFGEDFDLISNVTAGHVLLAGGITVIFAFAVNLVVAKKIKTIDMLQALKSVE